MNGPEQNVGLVLPDFEWQDEQALAQFQKEETQQQVILSEIVIECPVVVEFVGSDLSREVRNEVMLMVMDRLAGAMSYI